MLFNFLATEQRVKSFNIGRGRGLPKKIKRKDRGGRINKGPVFSGTDDFQEVLRIYRGRGEELFHLLVYLVAKKAL